MIAPNIFHLTGENPIGRVEWRFTSIIYGYPKYYPPLDGECDISDSPFPAIKCLGHDHGFQAMQPVIERVDIF
jgi:hypothetical protein